MAGTPSAQHPRAFVNAPFAEAVSALVEVLRELRPHVVVTYDPDGGYSHPDHIQAHRVCTAAIDALAGGAYRGPAKFYWTVMDAAVQAAAVAAMATVPPGWRRPEPAELPGVDPALVTTEIALDADARGGEAAGTGGARDAGERVRGRFAVCAVQQHRSADPGS